MIQSDRNTTFYHMSTLIRRNHNKILNLKDNQGEWITNIHAVMEFVRSSFITLFFTNLVVAPREVPPSEYICPQIFETEAQVLNLPVHINEIKHALWSLKASKALGSNGLHASFYQRFWLIVGQLVIKEIKKIFQEKRIPPILNQTLISLIPKIPRLETIGNFRPISFCNTMYKVITKILMARIKPCFDKLVSPFQTAFVIGRKGVDNAIITQELIHTIGRKKGRMGYMVIKIDLEKAYDRLKWSFIKEVLQSANFPLEMI